MSIIHYAKPSITERELAYAADAAANGWGPRCYEYIGKFEAAFAKHLGVKYAIATSSCTGAAHMGISALGLGPGDEVIVPDINWIASAAPITYVGATPVMVDVLPDTWCIDPAKVEAAITPRTRAIMAVHLYGNMCDLDALFQIGAKYSLPVIEDAAEALGSLYKGSRAGSMGAFATFSFHGTKTITTGEGGMFVTQDEALYNSVLTLSNHGRKKGEKKQFWADVVGFKYKMSNLQAAVGLAQVERIEELIAGKRRVFDYYRQGLADLPLTMNPEPPCIVNGYWMPTIVVDERIPFDREAVLAEFERQQIGSRVFFWPLTMQPMFADKPDNRVSYSLYSRALNLPSYHDLTECEMDRVTAVIRTALQ